MKADFLIFTDLDGTLLDHHTYSFDKALLSLKLIRNKEVPLILCSSKTKPEIEVFRKKLKNTHPFISENGGAIFVPRKYFRIKLDGFVERLGYWVKELGVSYPLLRKKLVQVTSKFNQPVYGFGDMNPKEISSLCGISHKDAELAKWREYDEPFYFLKSVDEDTLKKIQSEFYKDGFNLVKGGRLFHLTGQNDKGKAVEILTDLYQQQLKAKFKTIGLGDSLNDLPLLKACDFPILVKKIDGSYDKDVIARIKPLLADGIGPEGWNKAVLELLEKD
jgi:mannosyl-3-phosphoglycerate phosphatase